MNRFRNFCWLILCLATLVACKGKKKPSMSGEDPIEINDFIDFFPERTLPYQFNDSNLSQKEQDSLLIGNNVFVQFVPAAYITKQFGKTPPKIYPLAKVKGDDDENYLFAKAMTGDKKTGFVFVFDKNKKFLDGIALITTGQYPGAQQAVNIDKTYSVTRTITRKNPDGSISDGKDVYGLDKSSGKFVLVMTDALDDKVAELVNPIDTFAKKNKFAADYGTDKQTLVSIRDGRKSDRLSFYVHIDKDKGACTADLKGEAILMSPTVAEYRQGGDPCVLRFTFNGSSVSLKELEGCGSHRGVRCSFDGSFARHKEPKPPKKKPANHK